VDKNRKMLKRGFHPTQRTQRPQRNECKRCKKRKKCNERIERNSRKKRKLQPTGTELSIIPAVRTRFEGLKIYKKSIAKILVRFYLLCNL